MAAALSAASPGVGALRCAAKMEAGRRRGGRNPRPWILGLGAVVAFALAASPALALGNVLRVGSWHGVQGQFKTIQAAVDAARKGDWILIGPGDYHPRADYSKRHHAPPDESGSGVLIQTNGLHIRGMNRNRAPVACAANGSSPT